MARVGFQKCRLITPFEHQSFGLGWGQGRGRGHSIVQILSLGGWVRGYGVLFWSKMTGSYYSMAETSRASLSIGGLKVPG